MVESPAVRESEFRWKLGLGIFLAGICALIVMCGFVSTDLTTQVYWAWYLTVPLMFLIGIGWVLLSGLEWETRMMGVGAVVGVVGIFVSLFRFDGFTGSVIPRFVPRWNPSAEQQRDNYFRTNLKDLKTSPTQKNNSVAEVPQAVKQKESTPETEVQKTRSESGLSFQSKSNEEDWPRFRGPNQNSVVTDFRFPDELPDWKNQPPKLVWKHPVGEGWGSFAIVDNLLYTQEQHQEQECVVCYEAATGKPVWIKEDEVRFTSAMGGNGPRGTPTVSGDVLYSLGATGILNCLNRFTGETIWSRNILEDAHAENLGWGMSGSPLVVDQMVIVNPGGKNDRGVIAYEAHTGKIRWSAGNYPASYTAPMVAEIDSVRQVLIFDGAGLAGISLADGNELWRHPWTNTFRINAAQPLFKSSTQLFLSSGYNTGSGLIEVQRNDAGEWKTPEVLWRKKNHFKLKFNAAVQRNGYVYGLDDGILSCVEMSTGERQWKQGRYRFGQILLVGDIILVLAQSGEVALVQAIPEKFVEITKFQAIQGNTWNHPVIHQGKLYVRNGQEAACFELKSAK